MIEEINRPGPGVVNGVQDHDLEHADWAAQAPGEFELGAEQAQVPGERTQVSTAADGNLSLNELRALTGVGPTVNQVQWYTSGPEAYEALIEDVKAAKDSIRINLFSWADDDSGMELARAVVRARERGVDVQVRVDALGSYSVINSAEMLVDLPRLVGAGLGQLVRDAGLLRGCWFALKYAVSAVRTYFDPDNRDRFFGEQDSENIERAAASAVSRRDLLRSNRAIGYLHRHLNDGRSAEPIAEGDPPLVIEMNGIFELDHSKLLIIDDHVAYSGGMNFGDNYFGTRSRNPLVRRRREAWRDHLLRMEGEAAMVLGDLTFNDLKRASGQPRKPPVVENPAELKRRLQEYGVAALKALPWKENWRHYLKQLKQLPWRKRSAEAVELEHALEVTILKNRNQDASGQSYDPSCKGASFGVTYLLQHARKRVVLEHAYTMNSEVADLAIQAAARGVQVQIIRSQPASASLEYGNDRFIERIRLYNEGRDGSDPMALPIEVRRAVHTLHSKLMLVDDVIAVGSLNLSRVSMFEQGELLFLIDAADHPVHQKVVRYLESALLHARKEQLS